MRGELKLAIYLLALVAAAVFNVVVERLTGHHPGIASGTVLGVLIARLWPGLIFGDRS